MPNACLTAQAATARCSSFVLRPFLFYGSIITVAVVLFFYSSIPVRAQEVTAAPAADEVTKTEIVPVTEQSNESSVAPAPAENAERQATGVVAGYDYKTGEWIDGPADEQPASTEVALDETVTFAELGAVPARVLPDSPWHAFKRFGWKVQEAITIDPVKDASLKHGHAMQQLSEVKQMIEEKGINGVAPEVIQKAIERCRDKIEAVRAASVKVKGARDRQPEAVDALLSEVVDKQIKQQKVLENIAKEVVTAKATGETARVEKILSTVQATKTKLLSDVSILLETIEPTPEAVSQRLSAAMENQTGSPLRDLKHIAILEEMGKVAPTTVAAAIEKAKEESIAKFETRIKDVPPSVRAKTFTDYVKHTSGDETKLFQLLDEVQRRADLPSDILEKMEEAKEIMVRRFENKVKLIENPEVESDLLGDLEADSADDVIVLEEFRQRTSSGSEAKQLVAAEHDKAITAFKTRFTDAKSEEQAAFFRNLSQEMITKPSAKTFKFLKNLESEVRSDPAKSSFLDELNREMQTRVEDQYRREGEKFVTRFISLDPSDLEVIKTININQTLKDQATKKKTEKMKEYVRDLTEPEDFDRFYGRLVDAPKTVIADIKTSDPEFQQAMQFKWRKIEEERSSKERERQAGRLKVDYAERELRHQTDRVEQKKQEEFFQKLQDTSWDKFDERKAIWEEKINDSSARLDEKYTEQKRLFAERLRIDPFGCDEICRQAQLQFLDQEQRHARERLGDELARERNRIEAEKVRQQRNNPLAGKCTTPAECETYCRANRSLPECNWLPPEPVLPKCAPGTVWDQGRRVCIPTVEIVTACSAGFYWNGTTCVVDPYYRPPETTRACPFGKHWEEARGACVWDLELLCTPIYRADGTATYADGCQRPEEHFCPVGRVWDKVRRDCIDPAAKQCGDGYYFDYVSRRCESKTTPVCQEWQHWDPASRACVQNDVICPAVMPIPCPPGEHNESYTNPQGCNMPGKCVPDDVTRPQCPSTLYNDYNGGTQCSVKACDNGCFYGPNGCPVSCRSKPTQRCDDYRTPAECSTNAICDWFDKSRGGYGCKVKDFTGVCGDKYCSSKETPATCPKDCGAPPTTCNYNGVCDEAFEDAANCPADCSGGIIDACGNFVCDKGETATTCPRDCGGFVWRGICSDAVTSPGCIMHPECDWVNNACVARTAERCGDGQCSSTETNATCPADCKPAPDPLCATSPYYCTTRESCLGRGAFWCASVCQSGACSGGATCGNGICDPTESATSCATDCGASVNQCATTPALCTSQSQCVTNNFYWCNGACLRTACSGTACNNNGICDANETAASCAPDCGTQSCGAGWHYDTVARSCVRDGATCSTPKACDSCRTAGATTWCQWNSDGCPVSCQTALRGFCGDRACNNNETNATCPADCGGFTCNNNRVCDAGETAATCAADCQQVTACNNNGVCDYGESSASCANDCRSAGSCGDHICSSTETVATCPTDCGSSGCAVYDTQPTCTAKSGCTWYTPPSAATAGSCVSSGSNGTHSCAANWTWNSTSQSCVQNSVTCSNYSACSACPPGSSSPTGLWCTYGSDGCPKGCSGSGTCPPSQYNNNSATAICNNSVCPNGCTFNSSGCPTGCASATASVCGDRICNGAETSSSCPADCGTSTTETCGNGFCGTGETNTSCPRDCTTASTYCDGICANGESSVACPADCASGSKNCQARASDCTAQTACTSAGWYWCASTSICYSSQSVSPCATVSGSCGDGVCGSSESPANCPRDCGVLGGTCGDSLCSTTESCSTCASDCCPGSGSCSTTPAGCTGGPQCASGGWYWCTSSNACYSSQASSPCAIKTGSCGNHVCDSGETVALCPADCGTASACSLSPSTCTTQYDCTANGHVWCSGSSLCYGAGTQCASSCNNNGICDSNETMALCPNDCKITCNNNGFCDGSESAAFCPTECGSSSCSSQSSNCTTATMCTNNGWYWCSSNSICYSSQASSPCATPTTVCGDHICGSGETVALCPVDCEKCGNGVCGAGETSSSCPTDCGTSGGTTCSNPGACTSCPSGTYCQFDSNHCPTGCGASHSSLGPPTRVVRWNEQNPLSRLARGFGAFVAAVFQAVARASVGL